MRVLVVIAAILLCSSALASTGGQYQPNWDSLNTRSNPEWFGRAKFRLFMHWGLYAVPSYCSPVKSEDTCYAEWYGNYIKDHKSEQFKFHNQTYGADFKYTNFAPLFKAELFDPDEWADIFRRSGARAVIMTSKHHEGYTMWPSSQSWNWNAVDVGPGRDLLGDVFKSVRKAGMKAGLYYSLYEWFHPFYTGKDPESYVDQVMIPQMHDLATNYQPDIFYVDGEWDHESDFWKTKDFLAWLFNESPNRENVVINDRWGKECRGKNGGYYVCEYGGEVGGSCISSDPKHPWTAHEGMGKSFGYNRVDEYKNSTYFIQLLSQAVAYGGDLELNVGPTADGRIPEIQKKTLLEIGEWLDMNGEAIFDTEGAPYGLEKACEGKGTKADPKICYTANGDTVYAMLMQWPGVHVTLPSPKATEQSLVTMLGSDEKLRYTQTDDGLKVELPREASNRHAVVLKLTNITKKYDMWSFLRAATI